MGEGRHRLFLDGQVRSAIGKGPGARAEVRVRLDPSDRMPELPADLAAGLQAHDALDAWEALRPSRRKESLVVLADAKRATTRQKRITRIVQAAIEEGGPRLQP